MLHSVQVLHWKVLRISKVSQKTPVNSKTHSPWTNGQVGSRLLPVASSTSNTFKTDQTLLNLARSRPLEAWREELHRVLQMPQLRNPNVLESLRFPRRSAGPSGKHGGVTPTWRPRLYNLSFQDAHRTAQISPLVSSFPLGLSRLQLQFSSRPVSFRNVVQTHLTWAALHPCLIRETTLIRLHFLLGHLY